MFWWNSRITTKLGRTIEVSWKKISKFRLSTNISPYFGQDMTYGQRYYGTLIEGHSALSNGTISYDLEWS